MPAAADASSPSTSEAAASSSNLTSSDATNSSTQTSGNAVKSSTKRAQNPKPQPSSSKAQILSCAECRRSKLRCDRVFPCQACIRRGCGHLCPDGAQAATKGTKHLQAQSKVLSDQVKLLTKRVRELESALAKSAIAEPVESSETIADIFDKDNLVPLGIDGELAEGLGVLSIRSRGQTYHGQSASSEYIGLSFPDHSPEDADPDQGERLAASSRLPLPVEGLASTFPLGNCRRLPYGLTLAHLFEFVPTNRDDAMHLVQIYYRDIAWLYETISEADFVQSVVDPIYDGVLATLNSASHRLSLFFAVMACGSAYDTRNSFHTSADIDSLAERFLVLSRAAFALDQMTRNATVYTVQALFVMIMFMHATKRRGRSDNEIRWTIIGMCTRLAHSIGLHHENPGWDLPADEVDRRRRTFYELASFDHWMSIVNGRPPSILIEYTDCRLPQDLEKTPDGQTGYHNWKYHYAATCLSMSVKHIHSSTTPPYKTLLALDKKIRQFPVPEHLVAPVSISTGVLDTMPSGATGSPGGLSWSTDARHAMQQYAALCIKECNLMYLHRVYFYNALRTAGPNLLDHRFIVSVLATYRSARRLLSSMQSLYSVHPVPASRCWFFWTAYFSACFVLGIMVAKRPKSPFAAEAMQELTGAIPFYDRGSETCRPPHTLAALNTLFAHASEIYRGEVPTTVLCEHNDHILDIFGGQGIVLQPMNATAIDPTEFMDDLLAPHSTGDSVNTHMNVDSTASYGLGQPTISGYQNTMPENYFNADSQDYYVGSAAAGDEPYQTHHRRQEFDLGAPVRELKDNMDDIWKVVAESHELPDTIYKNM